jgi:hypothetical protein
MACAVLRKTETGMAQPSSMRDQVYNCEGVSCVSNPDRENCGGFRCWINIKDLSRIAHKRRTLCLLSINRGITLSSAVVYLGC